MSVIRVKHHKKYVVINKTALEDSRLSFKAKGLWAYCMSRPDDWEFHVSHLETVSKEKETAIYSAIQELIKCGYCRKIQKNGGRKQQKGRGSFWPVDYEIYEESCLSNNFSQPGFPDAENTRPENQELLSKDSTKSSFISKDIQEDEPIRTEPKEESDRIDRNGSASCIRDEEKKLPSLEEIEMILEHATKASDGKIQLKHSDIRIWVMKYGLERTIHAVDLAVQDMKSGSLQSNPPGWITNALKKGY